MLRPGCDDADVIIDGVKEDRCMCGDEAGDGRGEESQRVFSGTQVRTLCLLVNCVDFAMGLKKISEGVVVVVIKDLPIACFCMPSDILRYRY